MVGEKQERTRQAETTVYIIIDSCTVNWFWLSIKTSHNIVSQNNIQTFLNFTDGVS